MTPDDVWRITILITIAPVAVLVLACALLSWPVLQLARQWMWIATAGLLFVLAYGLCEVLFGWDSTWRLPALWGAIVAMGIGFAIQFPESMHAWKLRRKISRHS